MRKFLLASATALTIAIVPATPSSASGIPVIDASSLTQTIAQLQQQIRDYQEQVKQLTTLKDQFETMKKELEAVTGPKGISSILNGGAEKLARTAGIDLGSMVDAAISGGSLGGNTSDMKAKVDALKSRFGFSDLATLSSSTKTQDKAIASVAGSGLVSVATADDSYKRAGAAVARINQLVDGIDNTVDLKASVDFNTRVNAEVATLLLELIRVQAANAHTSGMNAIEAARDRKAARSFMKASN